MDRPGIEDSTKMKIAQAKTSAQKRRALCIRRSWHDIMRPASPSRMSERDIVHAMATCKSCGEDVEQLVTVKVGGKSKKLCEDCVDRAREEAEVAEASEAAVQN